MLKLSEILVNIVKKYDPSKNRRILLTASHYGTVGAVLQTVNKYGFTSEETLFRVVVREAVDKLNRDGWTRVDARGINEHEMDIPKATYRQYALVISNHFDASFAYGGQKATLHTHEKLAKQLNDIRNELTAPLGIGKSVLRHRSDLYMTSEPNMILFEWFAANDNYDVDRLLAQASASKPVTPTQPSTPAPAQKPKQWFEYCPKGAKWGSDETIIDAYNEIGGEQWYQFNNIPGKELFIYPGVYEAMKGINYDRNVTIVNGDEIKYYGVVITDKHVYIVYTRNNGRQGVISIKDKSTGRSYGRVK